jgi:uncharacterized membrane-anchored protein
MKKFIEKLIGIEKLKKEKEALQEARDKAVAEAVRAQETEELSKLSEKDRATRKKEPWVGVLNTHVNKDNVRNGFFELDWNEYFVLKLRQEGYGADGDKDEEIVDRWFRELCANVVVDGDYGGPINTGVIDINEVKRKNQ